MTIRQHETRSCGAPIGRAAARSACGLLLLALALPALAGTDTDGDGLPDDRERVTYGTDPTRVDSDGDGKPDGDPDERREYAYTIRSVLRVMRPVAVGALDDDHQEVRVLAETPEHVDLEVITYPFARVTEALRPSRTLPAKTRELRPYLVPGPTTNWDKAMARRLRKDLAADGIDVEALTDVELVRQVSAWLLRVSRHRNMFCTYYVDFAEGSPRVLAGTETAFERDRGDPAWSKAEQFAHELFGRSMFERRTYGTCTSAATYVASVMRALGVPTRLIVTIPVADASDPEQVRRVREGLRHADVRDVILAGLNPGSTSFTAHTLCEVFVGGRWVRLNYAALADGVLSASSLGLAVKVHVFSDLAEAGLAPTWGLRYAQQQRSEAFPFANPYRLLEVEDRLGAHAKEPLPVPSRRPQRDHERLTVTRAFWADGDEVPDWMLAGGFRKPAPGSDRMLIQTGEWIEGQDYGQMKRFMVAADPVFTLRSDGRPDIEARLTGTYSTGGTPPRAVFECSLGEGARERMARGVPYRLVPRNAGKPVAWAVADDVSLTR